MNNKQKLLTIIGIGGVALVLEFLLHQPMAARILISVVGSLMAISMLKGMIEVLKSGRYGVDILAISAIVVTLLVGEYWASLMILVMLTGGDALEDYASGQAKKELKSLLAKKPQKAHRLVNEEITDVEADELQIGDLFSCEAGESVPADGVIIDGESLCDESSLTGESLPVELGVGDSILSGTVNGQDALSIKVTKLAKDSQYQTIIRLVEEAQAQPAKFVRMADRYAVPFTLISFAIALVAWAISGDVKRVAQVLVVASPCPLILAAPVAIVSGMSRLSANGIIAKSGNALEKLAGVRSMAFDKTGTITSGILQVDKIFPQPGVDQDQMVLMAASAESHSNHILAQSLLQYERTTKLLPVEEMKEIPGNGLIATVAGHKIRIGKYEYIVKHHEVARHDVTASYIEIDGVYAGSITFEDHIRGDAKATVDALRSLGIAPMVIITGDQEKIAQTIAKQVGIDEIYANCLPQDKIDKIRALQKEHPPVAMVGDGVNDAPSLATADIGIAMGALGSTAASESADMVVMTDDLAHVATAIRIARRTMTVARQSVLIGIFICIGLMLIAATGVIPALFGAMLQEVVDTVAILSSLRARKA